MALIANADAPYSGVTPNGTTTPLVARFPVPAPIIAFVTDLDVEYVLEYSTMFGGVISGALFPEATHLEPTIGQIWPR